MVNTLYFVVGLPHSGKSDIVKNIITNISNNNEEYEHYEINMYSENNNNLGISVYASKEAHDWCREQVELAFSSEISNIIVSNPSLRIQYWIDYFTLAQNYGYNISIKMPQYNLLHSKTICAGSDQDRHFKRKIELNEETVNEMINEFKNIKKIYNDNKKCGSNVNKWLEALEQYI